MNMCLNNGGNILEYDINERIKESCLSSDGSIIIESAMSRFKKRIEANSEKVERVEELISSNKEIELQREYKTEWETELIIANKELAFKSEENAGRAAELIIANKELTFQSEEKAERAAELIIANKELSFQIREKADRAAELIIANRELAFQMREKADRAAELIIANKELAFQSGEKADRAVELIIANKELALQSEENSERAAELIIANKELAFQSGEKAEWAAELLIANKELKDRATKLIIANKELALQSKENEERAAELVIANKAQGEYFVNISHELKTPLNIICSTVQLFNMYRNTCSLDDMKNSIVKYMDSIKQNSYRLSKLINNIVDLSKIESGFFELHLSNNNIVDVVEEMVMSIADFTNSKGINIVFDTDVEEKIIACDSEKVERIVLNLISNAIKFSDEGDKIFVDVKTKNKFIEISVKDNGIGIEEKDLNMIFDRFKQVDKSLSRNSEGTGIGLSLVKAITELHGGSIHVESELGKGSKFTIMLPSRKVVHENILCDNKMINKNKTVQIELSDVYL